MSKDNIVDAVRSEMRAAMKSQQKVRLQTIRLIQAEIKRVEVDERILPNNERAVLILDKMLKQRRDSYDQFQKAGREDLAEKEQIEMKVIQEFLPEPMPKEDLERVINDAISDLNVSGMQAMGKVMGIIKPKLQGRADMSLVSELVKSRLLR